MPFAIYGDDEHKFMNEQAKLEPRIVGLIYPILIDRRLEAVIRGRWQDDPKGELLADIFRDGGALGSFQTRVQIGFAIGLYNEVMLADLKQIVKIRNRFAHLPSAHTFDDQPICDLTQNLKLPNHYPKRNGPLIITPLTTREEWIASLMHSSGLIDLTPLRHHFLRTAEIILTWLTIESGELMFPKSVALPPITPQLRLRRFCLGLLQASVIHLAPDSFHYIFVILKSFVEGQKRRRPCFEHLRGYFYRFRIVFRYHSPNT